MAKRASGQDRSMTQRERLSIMLVLARVVKETGEFVLQTDRADIFDTAEADRHVFSNIDGLANRHFRGLIEATAVRPMLGTVLEESNITKTLVAQGNIKFPVLIVDTIEGSTNAKRSLAAFLRRPTLAGVSAVVLETVELSSVAASAFFDFASRRVYASVRTEKGSFLSFVDNELIDPEMVLEVRGDSKVYTVVPNYSNSNVEERAAIERALINQGIYTTGGTRSSAQDLLDIVCNHVDAYLDLRALFSAGTQRRDEVLHIWDVGGVLPVLDGLGFLIADVRRLAENRSWQSCQCWDPMALLVARPEVGVKILQIIRELPLVDERSEDEGVVPMQQPVQSI